MHDFKKNNNVSYVLIDKKKYYALLESNKTYEEKLKELTHALGKINPSQDFELEYLKISNELNSYNLKCLNEIEKDRIDVLYIYSKCDLLFQEIWFTFPRFYFSEVFSDKYLKTKEKAAKEFFNPNFKELGNKFKYFDLWFRKEQILALLNIDEYPIIHMSLDYSKQDPTYLKYFFITALRDEAILFQLDEKNLSKLDLDSVFTDKTHISEKSLLSLERNNIRHLKLLDIKTYD